MAAPAIPTSATQWQQQRTEWMHALREKSFGGWPADRGPLQLERKLEQKESSLTISQWEFTSQDSVRLPITVETHGPPEKIKRVYLYIMDQAAVGKPLNDPKLRAELISGECAVVTVAPRGIHPINFHQLTEEPYLKEQVQVRRRYMLLGQTLDGMRVWDICRAVEALRQLELFGNKPVHMIGVRDQAVNALYASLFIDGLASVQLDRPPASHMSGPDYLNVLRFLDIPQAAAMAAERQPVRFTNTNPDDWSWTTKAAKQLGWPADRLQW
jgi:hypothetical protein